MSDVPGVPAEAVTLAALETDPHPVLARLRAAAPVTWVPVLGAWLVTGYGEAVAVLRDARTFTVDDPRFSTATVVGPSMLSLDGPRHARHRAPFTRTFRSDEVHARLAAFIRAEAGRLVTVIEPRGAGELRRAVAGPLAAAVMAEVLGLRAGRGLIPAAIEESLRLEPAAAVVDRYATADAVLAGLPIRAGDQVTVSIAAANRDPSVFTDPDAFDVRRPNAARHLAFAHGPHFCIGAHLARLEAQVAVDTVLQRLPRLRLDPRYSSAPRGLVFRKPPDLCVRWDRG
jgi:cytochrome P450